MGASLQPTRNRFKAHRKLWAKPFLGPPLPMLVLRGPSGKMHGRRLLSQMVPSCKPTGIWASPRKSSRICEQTHVGPAWDRVTKMLAPDVQPTLNPAWPQKAAR